MFGIIGCCLLLLNVIEILTQASFLITWYNFCSAVGKLLAVAIHRGIVTPLDLLAPDGAWRWMLGGTNLEDIMNGISLAQKATGRTVSKGVYNTTLLNIQAFIENVSHAHGLGWRMQHTQLVEGVRSLV